MHKRRHTSRFGFSLIEVTLLVLLVTLVISGAVIVDTVKDARVARELTKTRLDAIAAALATYAATNSYYPCVATFTSLQGTAGFGTIAKTNCDTDTAVPAGTLRYETGTGSGVWVRAGAVPVRDLGLDDSYIEDAWGNRITYVVTESLTGTAAYTAGEGTLQILNTGGYPIANKAAFVLVSHGMDGKGAYRTATGVNSVACGATANLDVENCDNDAVFRKAKVTDTTIAAASFNDDIVLGVSKGLETMCFRADGVAASDQAGYRATGDINGDGYTDIVLASYAANSNAGAVYVVFGTSAGIPNPINLSSLNGTTGFKINGNNGPSSCCGASQNLGGFVAVGNINGDVYDDMLIGHNMVSGAWSGQYVIFGKAGGWAASASASSYNNGTTNGFYIESYSNWTTGSAVIGDMNGDGFGEICFSHTEPTYGVDAKVYCLYGKAAGSTWHANGMFVKVNSASFTTASGFSFYVSAPNYTWFGEKIAMGDINGDGLKDLLMTSRGGNIYSYVYVIFGKAGTTWTMNMDPATWIDGTTSTGFRLRGDWIAAGYSDLISIAAGNINGDTNGANPIEDILIGSKTQAPAPANGGRIYVVFGKTGNWSAATTTIASYMTGTDGFYLYGDTNDELYYARNTGNLNTDAYKDLIVSAGETTGFTRNVAIYGKAVWTSPIQLSAIVDGTQAFGISSSTGDAGAMFTKASVDTGSTQEIAVWVPAANSSAGYTYGMYGKATWGAANYDVDSYCSPLVLF